MWPYTMSVIDEIVIIKAETDVRLVFWLEWLPMHKTESAFTNMFKLY